METIKDTGWLLYCANTAESREDIPDGHIDVYTVRYARYRYKLTEFEDQVFEVHDANCEEARIIAKLTQLDGKGGSGK